MDLKWILFRCFSPPAWISLTLSSAPSPFTHNTGALRLVLHSHSLSLMNKVKKTLPAFSSLTLKYSFWLRLSPYRLCAGDYLHVFSRPATYKLSSPVSHVLCSPRAAPMK